MQKKSEETKKTENLKYPRNILNLLYVVFFACIAFFILAFFNVGGFKDKMQSKKDKESYATLNVFYIQSNSLEDQIVTFIASKIIQNGSNQIPNMASYNDSLLILDGVVNNIARDNQAIVVKDDSLFSFENTKNITGFVLEKFKEEFNKRYKEQQ